MNGGMVNNIKDKFDKFDTYGQIIGDIWCLTV